MLLLLVVLVVLPIRKGRSRTVAETASAAHAAARGLSRRCGGGGGGSSGDRSSVAIARYASCWWMVGQALWKHCSLWCNAGLE